MYQNSFTNYSGDRQILPFLGGALIGGAAVGLTRPRPIYNVAPNRPYPPYAPYPPMGPGPYGFQSYGYYFPYGR